MNEVQHHFDHIAKDYDGFKKKNWYYYAALKKIYREQIPAGKKVLEIGCGTGDILASLNPVRGLGIDISEKMIDLARQKYGDYRNLEFRQGDIISFKTDEKFDYIFLADVIEHLGDVGAAMKSLAGFASSTTKVVITMANPIWEPVLMLAEKLGLKMPEGPHERISVNSLIKICRDNNMELRDLKYRLPFPKYLPVISGAFNRLVENTPVLNRVGFLVIFELRKGL